MTRFETMASAARQAMIHVLGLQPQNQVLVVSDKVTRTCSDAFARGAERHGCPVETYLLPEAERPLKTVPADLLNCLADADIVINAIAGDDREVPFRIEWIKAIEANGTIRLGHSPGIDEDMMVGGPLDVDYAAMVSAANELIAAFAGARSLHVTAPGGTDLHLDLTNRWFATDVKATEKEGSNLPCGEIYCCPVEAGAEGVLVVDGCFGGYGNVPSPIKMTIKGGQVTNVSSDDDEVVETVNAFLDTDNGSRTIAELGIGLNTGARLTPKMLEAEKAKGTAHIAFGSNEGMPGGQSISTIHMDYLFLKPTITAISPNKSKKVIIKNGTVL